MVFVAGRTRIHHRHDDGVAFAADWVEAAQIGDSDLAAAFRADVLAVHPGVAQGRDECVVVVDNPARAGETILGVHRASTGVTLLC